MNYTEKGSKLYLFSIVLVAVIGGLLFGYDTAVISGADKGLQAFFMGAPDFVYTDTIHGITSSSALIGCIIGSALSGFFASNLGRKNSLFIAGVLFFLSALGSYYPEFLFLRLWCSFLFLARGIQLLPCIGRNRRWFGIRHLPDVYCGNCAEQHSRDSGIMEPVCHYLRPVSGLLREFPYFGREFKSGDKGH